MSLQKNTAYIPRKVFPEAQDIPSWIRRSTEGQVWADVMGWHTWHDDSTGSPGKGKENHVKHHKQSKVWGALRVFPGGDQVDGLPPAPSHKHILESPQAI